MKVIKNKICSEEDFKNIFLSAYKRYKLYVNYYIFKTGKNIFESKDYQTAMIKWLIAYFLYKENNVTKEKKITLVTIAKLLHYENHTGVSKAMKNIENLLKKQPKIKIKDKYIKDYFMIFNSIFIQTIKS